MAHCILADHLGFSQPTPQGENLPSPQLIVPNDSLAENPGKASLSQHLRAESEKSNNKRSASEGLSIEEPDWSLVAGNGDINCNSRSQNPADQYFPQSRFARSLSRLFKRQNNNDLCTFPESQNLQGETKNQAPVRQPENQKKPARVIPPSGETIRNMDADRLLMLIITQPHSQGNPNPEKCKHNLAYQVPICSPKTPGQPQLTQFSPQVEVVVPSRFCMFSISPFLRRLTFCLFFFTQDTQDIWGGGGPRSSSRTVKLIGILEIFSCCRDRGGPLC